jgi:outer membrane murein-binding lipoprotein Lpp
MAVKRAIDDGDLQLIGESLAAIAETEMRIETKVDRLVKDVQANCEITNRANEQLLTTLTKKMDEQNIHVCSLSVLAGKMEESGLLDVIVMIKGVRKFARWVLVVIGAGVIGVLFNQGVSAYAKIIDKKSQAQTQQVIDHYNQEMLQQKQRYDELIQEHQQQQQPVRKLKK